ncbi:MAG TPA: cytochrome c [Mucilaginibacter sp.]|jgi:mono/diheme cytochrome c family protein|nr:cytochrome c [Mucilaginibacter sp.]
MRLKAAGVTAFILLPLLMGMFISCQSDTEVEFQRYYSNGGAIYQAHCQNCHGAHGEGLQALIPPLNDTAYIKTNKSALPCFIRNGMKGQITLSSRRFEGEMPASELAPVELAAVLTYISNSFGNKLGLVKSEQVEGDLKGCK